MMALLERNWRYLAWRRWPELDSGARTAALLASAETLTAPMLEAGGPEVALEVARIFEVPAADLGRRDLLAELVEEDSDVVALANIMVALRQKAADGRLHDIARVIDVDVSTVSRWVTGVTSPKPGRFRALARALFLPTDYETTPYFLLDQPLIHAARVAELHHLLGLMTPETLRDLYPGLRVLLRRPGERV
ncbi:helix-turn-helix domain-containing protein [Deinococcus rufus]|uniref:Helix-turn-helix domain-containing protein n=1 Tax=Deinococcus rufus TaxID=2136097 RepID=A0ABV7Z8P3_9DEIO